MAIGKASSWRSSADLGGHVTTDIFADKAIEAIVFDAASAPPTSVISRATDAGDAYYAGCNSKVASKDFSAYKIIAGSVTELGSEAVDLPRNTNNLIKASWSGSTGRFFREDMVTPKFSVTDTSIESGKFGVGSAWGKGGAFADGILRAPSSPSPRAIAYFEVPIVGSGTMEDPFRAQLPEEIVLDWSLNPQLKRKYDILKARGFTDEEILELFPEFDDIKVNRLALTNSALIKSGKDGKPVEYRAILRIFEQPGRSPSLAPIDRALDAIRDIPGVRRLDRETAIREAKRLDDKLHDLDLRSARKLLKGKKKAMKEYKEWRVYSLDVKEELIEDEIIERYVEEDKGWD